MKSLLRLAALSRSSPPNLPVCRACQHQQRFFHPSQATAAKARSPSARINEYRKQKGAYRERVSVDVVKKKAKEDLVDKGGNSFWSQEFDDWFLRFIKGINLPVKPFNVRQLVGNLIYVDERGGDDYLVTGKGSMRLSDEQARFFLSSCAREKINPRQIVVIARVMLRRKKDTSTRYLAKLLLEHASAAGLVDATLYLVYNALRAKNLSHSDLRPILEQLKKLAEQGTDFRPMGLHAMVLDESERPNEAAAMFIKAVQLIDDKIERKEAMLESPQAVIADESGKASSDAVDLGAAHVLREWADFQLRHKINGVSGPEEAFAKAALKFNDPQSYAWLRHALPADQKYSAKWYEYAMKAATAADADACCELAELLSLSTKEVEEQVTDPLVLAELERLGATTGDLFATAKLRDKEDKISQAERARLSWAAEWLMTGVYMNHVRSILANAQLEWRFSRTSSAVGALMMIGLLNESNGLTAEVERRVNQLLNEWCEADPAAAKAADRWTKQREMMLESPIS